MGIVNGSADISRSWFATDTSSKLALVSAQNEVYKPTTCRWGAPHRILHMGRRTKQKERELRWDCGWVRPGGCHAW